MLFKQHFLVNKLSKNVMYWQDSEQSINEKDDSGIVDLVYSIECACLPVDHIYALSQAIQEALPWFAVDTDVGLHSIYGAASGNGWIRPEAANELLHLSKRTKLTLRIPRHRVKDAEQLVNNTITVLGYSIRMLKFSIKPLSDITTLYSRSIVSSDYSDEQKFLHYVSLCLKDLGIIPKKLMCGATGAINTPEGKIETRSIMLAELSNSESMLLQQKGLGSHRRLGCGLFIPHKDINDVR